MTPAQLLRLVAFGCWLLAALIVAAPQLDVLGPALAWFFGGFAAWALSHVVKS